MTKKAMIDEMIQKGWIGEDKRNHFMKELKKHVTWYYEAMKKFREGEWEREGGKPSFLGGSVLATCDPERAAFYFDPYRRKIETEIFLCNLHKNILKFLCNIPDCIFKLQGL